MTALQPAASPADYGDPVAEYQAARAGVVAVRRTAESRLRALGRDRLDFLHRMSTNDLAGLPVGAARETVLTTPIARIVDLLWVVNLGDTALCLASPGRATAVRRWLAGYIFFRDEVKLVDASAELDQFALYGPGAAAVAAALVPGAELLERDQARLAGEGVVVRGRPLAGDGFTVVAPAAEIEAGWARALSAGAVPAGETAYQWLRLAAGQPAAGHELTEDYLPLEANLWPAVSFQKGCYIGQEIIARMESRGKLARRLVGLRLESPAAVGAPVRAAGVEVGSVTSAGVLPDLGPVALAYLRTTACEPGTAVVVGDQPGRVAALPLA